MCASSKICRIRYLNSVVPGQRQTSQVESICMCPWKMIKVLGKSAGLELLKWLLCNHLVVLTLELRRSCQKKNQIYFQSRRKLPMFKAKVLHLTSGLAIHRADASRGSFHYFSTSLPFLLKERKKAIVLWEPKNSFFFHLY